MRKVIVKVVRPWPAEQPRPPVVRLAPRPANDALPFNSEKRRA